MSAARASLPAERRSLLRTWGVKFALIFALLLLPWPGWGDAFVDAYCAASNAVASIAPSGGFAVLFRPGDDPAQDEQRRPWRYYVYLRRTEDGAIERMMLNARLTYASIATFVALTLASVWQRHKTRLHWLVGLPAVVAVVALNSMNHLVLGADRWQWISLGPAREVTLSAGYALLNGMPVVPFALPGLLWWGLLVRQNGSPRRPSTSPPAGRPR